MDDSRLRVCTRLDCQVSDKSPIVFFFQLRSLDLLESNGTPGFRRFLENLDAADYWMNAIASRQIAGHSVFILFARRINDWGRRFG